VHLLLVAVVVVVGVVAVVALYDSTRTSAPTGTQPLDAAAVARTVGPAVVDLDVSLDGGHTSATGMVVTPTGEVVTNNHSIVGATAITARIAGTGRTYVGTVVGYDVPNDVAVLQLADASGLATIERGDPSALAGGEPVLVFGSAADVGGAPAPLAGVVTGLDRQVGAAAETLHGMVQINVPIRARDSGGPVVDAGATVIAMATAAPGGGRFREQTSDSMTFALPIDDVFAVVDRIDSGQSTTTVHVGPRATLGIAVRPTSPDGGAGAYVVSVQSDGPAAQAGLAADTIIVSIDDTTVPTTAALDATLDRYRPGDVVHVGWVGRDSLYQASDVRLVTGPPA
jgi:S1-C subfamily serine protease